MIGYIPEFRGDGKAAVSVHHLLSHTSGIEDSAIFAYMQATPRRRTIAEPGPTEHPVVSKMLHDICDAPLSYAVGQQHLYSNFNNLLIAEIVRRVSGRALADFDLFVNALTAAIV